MKGEVRMEKEDGTIAEWLSWFSIMSPFLQPIAL